MNKMKRMMIKIKIKMEMEMMEREASREEETVKMRIAVRPSGRSLIISLTDISSHVRSIYEIRRIRVRIKMKLMI